MSFANAPHQSCDCHVHVFGDPTVYPAIAGAAYEPPPYTIAELDSAHQKNGIARSVLVQPLIYGTDHRVLLHALSHRSEGRGVAIIDDGISDDQLRHMHDFGIRGVRFGVGSKGKRETDRDMLDRTVSRIQKLGWHIKLGGGPDYILANQAWLRDLTLPVVIDHLAGLDSDSHTNTPTINVITDLLGRPNWWIMIANADRRSRGGYPWTDMLPVARNLVQAAAGRAIWASDWPHVSYKKSARPEFPELLEFMFKVIEPATTMEAVLVENPVRLYGFTSTA